MSIYQDLVDKKKSISVTGLGYVGLPLALEFAKYFRVIGFDINQERVDLMRRGIDPSKELEESTFNNVDITFTTDFLDLKSAHFHIIGVPTDIDEHKVPNLKPLLAATKTIGKILKPGDFVVYESTVYPGCTEEDCLPILETESNLTLDAFSLGYSPERIVPGEKLKTLTKILKIVSGNNPTSLIEISNVYKHIIEAGVYEASSIKVAEAAKVIENTQRDINISLMNELAIIFDKMEIDTREVIEAASTKWNFNKYFPGLVGGHCISIDPYYLIHKAKQVGLDPQVIAAGRRVNDRIPHYIAKKLVQALIEKDISPKQAKILVMGVTFKENVTDIRNSKVIDLVSELEDYSLEVHVTDPYASSMELQKEFSIDLIENLDNDYDAIIIAVAHKEYRTISLKDLENISKQQKLILFDIKGIKKSFGIQDYWSL